MENRFIRAEDVAQELNVSKPYAYKLIRQLNEELKAKGFITIAGRPFNAIWTEGYLWISIVFFQMIEKYFRANDMLFGKPRVFLQSIPHIIDIKLRKGFKTHIKV